MLVLHPDVPATSIPELIAYAKANPGKLSFASGNTSGVVAGETLKFWAGINIVHVPYRTTPPALNDLLGGRVSMMFADLTTGLPHVKADKLRALAVTRLQRSSLFPSCPPCTKRESPASTWIPGRACSRRPIRRRRSSRGLSAELRKIFDNPEVKARTASLGFEAFSSSPEELGEYVKVQLVKWTKMIKDARIEPE